MMHVMDPLMTAIMLLGKQKAHPTSLTLVKDRLVSFQDTWPFVQLFSFSNDVTIQYNPSGQAQRVNLEYDDIPNISFSLDRDLYPQNSEVFVTVNDFQLNQDPTDEDSWTFNIDSPVATFYQAFDNNGQSSADGTIGLVNLIPELSNLGFEDNGILTVDLNSVSLNYVQIQIKMIKHLLMMALHRLMIFLELLLW